MSIFLKLASVCIVPKLRLCKEGKKDRYRATLKFKMTGGASISTDSVHARRGKWALDITTLDVGHNALHSPRPIRAYVDFRG